MDKIKQPILIVDDEPNNLQLMRKILADEYKLSYATNGIKAIEAVQKTNPDLILLDIMMPEMDGYEVCQRLKTDPKVKDIPIIFMTALSDVEDEVKGFELGCVDYITKPISPSIVKARIKHYLELQRAYDEIKAANKKTLESLRYAGLIQKSLLPTLDEFKANFPDSFVIWMPRDIVGGDIMYADFQEKKIIGAVIDCTGHGVPGAFMSMIASSGLRKIVNNEVCNDPAEILKKLNYFVKTSLQQDTANAQSDDGMDVAVCVLDKHENAITFASARQPLYYIHKNNLTVIKGDRQSIGYKKSDLKFNYTNHHISIEEDMCFYMFTDGFVDQLGGEKRFSFGGKRFRELLLANHHKPFEEQRKILINAFQAHKGKNERQDDVTVVGFKV